MRKKKKLRLRLRKLNRKLILRTQLLVTPQLLRKLLTIESFKPPLKLKPPLRKLKTMLPLRRLLSKLLLRLIKLPSVLVLNSGPPTCQSNTSMVIFKLRLTISDTSSLRLRPERETWTPIHLTLTPTPMTSDQRSQPLEMNLNSLNYYLSDQLI